MCSVEEVKCKKKIMFIWMAVGKLLCTKNKKEKKEQQLHSTSRVTNKNMLNIKIRRRGRMLKKIEYAELNTHILQHNR